MKIGTCILILLFLFNELASQVNLIGNPSFEDYTSCNYDFVSDKLEDIIPEWHGLIRAPYYYNSNCENENYPNFEFDAIDGDAFVVGINSVFQEADIFGLQQRHYFQILLKEALIVNEEYYLSFYISPGTIQSKPVSKLGVRFTDNLELSPYYSNFPFYPYLVEPSLISDTILAANTIQSEWTKVEFCFSVDSMYQSMQVGYFSPIDSMEFESPVSGNYNFTAYDHFELYQVPNSASLRLLDNDTICVNNCIIFSTDHSLIPGDFNWTFEGGDITFSEMNEVEVCYDVAGIYDVSLHIEHCNVIIDTTFSKAVTVLDEIQYELMTVDTAICPQSAVLIDLSTIVEDVQWNDGSDSKIRELPVGEYAYLVDNGYCSANYSFEITELFQLEENYTQFFLCPKDTFLHGLNEIYADTIVIDTIHSTLQCDSVYSYSQVIVSKDPMFESFNQYLCKNDTIIWDLPLLNGMFYVNEELVEHSIEITEAGTYSLEYVDSLNCVFQDSILIVSPESVSVVFNDVTDITFDSEFALIPDYSGDIISFQWFGPGELSCYDCVNTTILSPVSGIYGVEVVDIYGCISTTVIHVRFKKSEYYIPNIINPLSNIVENRSFYLQTAHDVKYDLEIYDRWGNQIFSENDLESNNDQDAWKPGEKYNSGVFAYHITIHDKEEGTHLFGSISLVR